MPITVHITFREDLNNVKIKDLLPPEKYERIASAPEGNKHTFHPAAHNGKAKIYISGTTTDGGSFIDAQLDGLEDGGYYDFPPDLRSIIDEIRQYDDLNALTKGIQKLMG